MRASTRQVRASWAPAVGLFGPRREFAGGRLAAYRILNAPASAIHPATQREAGREGRADAPRSPVGSPPISTPYGWSEDVTAAQRRLEEELRG